MTATQRRVTFAICISVGLTFLISAGLTFLVNPMSEDLGLSDGDVEAVLAIPSIASLIVIFIAGQTGDQLGHRRALLIYSGFFALGGSLLAIAPGRLLVFLGLALCGASATAIQIVALALLQQTIPEGPAHVSAFTTYGMVYPFAYLTIPVLTAGLLDVAAWRVIPIIWAAAGLVIALIVAMLIARSTHRHPIGEWLTPLLAGIALAGGVRFLVSIGRWGLLASSTLIGFMLMVIAIFACWARYRSTTTSGFSLAPIRSSLTRALLLGVTLVALVGTLTYVILALQDLYDMSPLEASLAVIPAQLGAIIGAKFIGGRTIRRWGIGRAGRRLTLILSVSVLPLVAMQASTPAWYLVVCATLFNTIALAAVTVLNTDVMSRAPRGATGPMSSFRGAASSLGSGLGVVVLGTSVISAVNMSAGPAEVTNQQAADIAAGLRIDGILGFLVSLLAWATLTAVERRSASKTQGNSLNSHDEHHAG